MKIAGQVAAIAMSLAGLALAMSPVAGLAQAKASVPMVLISQANEAGFDLGPIAHLLRD